MSYNVECNIAKLGDVDGECSYITKCQCGETYEPWAMVIDISKRGTLMPCCGRRLLFQIFTQVYEVKRDAGDGFVSLGGVPASAYRKAGLV